ncbi:MAG: homocysteine S-methyltransferase family protein [Oscillospiraceae bacterium]|nr:homocysteine S-methyltransferase family protein [Oscillospiraceae bacterium]
MTRLQSEQNPTPRTSLIEFTKHNLLILDGAMGTMLQSGHDAKAVHEAYLAAGANVILTNTFHHKTDEDIHAAVQAAKQAIGDRQAFVALDISPTGQLLEPMGMLSFDDAYAMFKRQVLAGVQAGVDAIYIETMTELGEARCAVLAAKENCDLPVFCTMSFEENMRTFTGVDIPSMALTLSGLGVDFIGLNCSVGPAQMKAMAAQLLQWTDLPVIIKPNAGLPKIENGKTVFDVTPEVFAAQMTEIAALGVAGIGGCCGTTPAFIQAISTLKRQQKPAIEIPAAVCSATKTVLLDRVRVVGERINPTGKKAFQQALLDDDLDYIAEQAIEQVEAGADILDVNVGMPGVDEPTMMASVVTHVQSMVHAPLQIDSTNPAAIEAGLRACRGKAIVNSVNGEEKSLREILPLVKKYGAAVIGLTLDENGIPPTAQQRLAIAEKILAAALAHGIPRQDVFIDCLALAAGAEQSIAYATIDAIRLVKEQLELKTTLGVSNVSFGLPAREKLNQTFLSLALANGLDLPILNPNSTAMLDTIACFHQLKNIDKNSDAYIQRFHQATQDSPSNDIAYFIHNGLQEEARAAAQQLLREHAPLAIVNEILLPVLDAVGKQYETGAIFLPQLMRSAQAAKAAFDTVKENLPPKDTVDGETILLATVEGDIHDIGKNIVKVVLENYGYRVIDLGKDVPAAQVAEQALHHNAKLVGLSALMTTTLVGMENTIKAVKQASPNTAVVVGGAVLTTEIAQRMGADHYAKDAIEAVAIAKKTLDNS